MDVAGVGAPLYGNSAIGLPLHKRASIKTAAQGGGKGPNLVPADLSAALQAAASAGITVSATQITFSAVASLGRARIVPTAAIVNGGRYELKYRVSGRSAGNVAGFVYGTSQNGNGPNRAADGSYVDIITITPGGSFNQCFSFQANAAGTTLVVDQIELRQLY